MKCKLCGGLMQKRVANIIIDTKEKYKEVKEFVDEEHARIFDRTINTVSVDRQWQCTKCPYFERGNQYEE